MYQVKAEEKEVLVSLFAKHSDSLIISCIQNYMGEAWIDDAKEPKSGFIIVGDFCFLAGEPSVDTVAEIEKVCPRKFTIAIADNENWYSLIEQIYAGKFEKTERYAIKKEGDIFDRALLKNYISKLPAEYELRMIGEKEYHSTLSQKWSLDFCQQYETWEEYKEKGLGVVILHNGEIIAGASSYASYREGIEIEIITRQDYRRKGLALITGAKLILETLERNMYPNWDAQNMMSVGVAQKLGYHYDAPYVAYDLFF